MKRIVRFLYYGYVLLVSAGFFNVIQAAPVTTNVIENQSNDEHVVWQRAPIKITLPVGKERFVSFPSRIVFGYNSNLLPPSTLRVENDNQTLYLLAKKPFATQRVQAKLSNGDIILLDLSAQQQADDKPIDIVLPKIMNGLGNINDNTNRDVSSANVNYITLTRYAIQQMYSPKRLLKHDNNITRFPMETIHVVPLINDGSGVVMPLASWRGDDLYVTALLIKNQLNQPLHLKPSIFCGDWKAASFYPQVTLAPRGTPINRDATTLFIVSDKPFAQAIRSCLTYSE